MTETKDPIVYRYRPGVDGDGFPGVPRRDLRQSEVDALFGAALLNVTSPAGEGIYRRVEHRDEPAHEAAAPKAAAKADDQKGGD